MEHLSIHLAEKALMGGAVQFRWMYPIERYLSTLKNLHQMKLSKTKPRASRREIDRLHSETFHEWFKNYINGEEEASSSNCYSEEIKQLANGPTPYKMYYNSCIS
ncbi:hypothetical protein LIER_19534 [Lithospermum erythrorhizon]|uniref:DUF4218 domain-containing protein n=1 Tax=Lithospermum erythrorhizon TaxID=34254 RepID=A0AAV3QJM6_LITER